MKNFFKVLSMTALAAVIGFGLTSCDNGGGGPETLTYKGKGAASGDTYTLTITKTAARAFTPIQGDEFELTDGTDKSKGKVDSFNGSNLTLQPSYKDAPAFDATVSGNDLTGLSGTITLTDGRRVTVDETLTPVSPPGGGGNMTWTRVEDSTIWDFAPGTSGTKHTINAIAYGNNKFVAVGDDGKMAYSADGRTWTAVADAKVGDDAINAIAFGGGKFVAGNGRGKMATSSDGVTWTAAHSIPVNITTTASTPSHSATTSLSQWAGEAKWRHRLTA